MEANHMTAQHSTAQHIFIHPGFGKSGTTTIQENIFGKHDQILSIGRPYSDLNSKIRKEIGKIEGLNYNAEIVASLVESAFDVVDASKNKCIVLSDETLLSNAYMRNTIANRLRVMFQNAHIIFTIRNQIKALESYYGNHGRVLKGVPDPFNGRYVSLDNWLSYAYKNKETTYLGLINYYETIGMWEKIFGSDHVHVFLFEEFVSNKKSFSEKLSKLLSIDEEQTYSLITEKWNNSRDPGRAVAYTRIREKILPGVSIRSIVPFGNILQQWFTNYLSKGKGVKVEISSDWRKCLSDYYREGNSQLMKTKGLPLDKYGYPI